MKVQISNYILKSGHTIIVLYTVNAVKFTDRFTDKYSYFQLPFIPQSAQYRLLGFSHTFSRICKKPQHIQLGQPSRTKYVYHTTFNPERIVSISGGGGGMSTRRVIKGITDHIRYWQMKFNGKQSREYHKQLREGLGGGGGFRGDANPEGNKRDNRSYLILINAI